MPIIDTGVPLISGLASADMSGLHKQQQDDQVFQAKLQRAMFELQQDQKNAALQEEQRAARTSALSQLAQSEFSTPEQQQQQMGPTESGKPLTAAAGVELDQQHQKHVQMATQIAPLLGKLDDQTLNRVLTEMHGQVLRDQDSAARKHASEWIDRLAASMGGEQGAPPEVQQAADGLKQMLADQRTDPADVIKHAMDLAAPKLAQERDDQRAQLLAAKAEAALGQTGKLPSEYAHNQILMLQHGIGDTKFFEANFDKIMAGMEPVGSVWVDSKDAPAAKKAVAESLSMKNQLQAAQAELAQMRALYEQARPKLEADKNASASADRAEGLKLRSRGLDIRETQGQENLKLRASGQESAAQSRGETLNLGKRNAERSTNAQVLEAAQKDPKWADADEEGRAKIEAAVRAKLVPKGEAPKKDKKALLDQIDAATKPK